MVARGDARDADGARSSAAGPGDGDDEVRVAARGHLREVGDAEDLLRTGGGETSEGVAYSRADATADAAIAEDWTSRTGEVLSVGAHVGVVFGHDGGHLQSEHEASLFYRPRRWTPSALRVHFDQVASKNAASMDSKPAGRTGDEMIVFTDFARSGNAENVLVRLFVRAFTRVPR